MRRIYYPALAPGRLTLATAQAHHVRDVLRLGVGDELELFDDSGATALARIELISPRQVAVEVTAVHQPTAATFTFDVASAVPKGARADWMVEKLSELGTRRFIPLSTARSVVEPGGRNKIERWQRLAAEAARQSRRPGMMEIAVLTSLPAALDQALANGAASRAWCLSTGGEAQPVGRLLGQPLPPHLTLFVGPEGGWSEDEVDEFRQAAALFVRLGATVLRIETAALAAAALAASLSPQP